MRATALFTIPVIAALVMSGCASTLPLPRTATSSDYVQTEADAQAAAAAEKERSHAINAWHGTETFAFGGWR